MFYQEAKDLRAVIHGDDFTLSGGDDDLDWFREKIKNKMDVKFRARLGAGSKDDKSVRILNRVLSVEGEGIMYEADQRHG